MLAKPSTLKRTRAFFSNGFTGFSLYTGGDEKLFVGDINGAGGSIGWTIAASHLGSTPQYTSTNQDTAVTGLFSYNFNTGFSTLQIDGQLVASGLLPSAAAVDRVKIWNNGGGDVILSNLAVRLVPEPTTLLIWSLLAGLGVGLGWRRRK